jgi:iron complex outermembrane receptor protein
MTMKKLMTLAVGAIASIHIAAAQTENKDTVEYVYPTEIVVTAPRMNIPMRELPFSTSIAGYDIMRNIPRSIAVDEPMKLVPGVKVDNQANGSRVHLSIRGQGILTERGIRGIKILLDGLPINDPTGFAPDFFDIDFATVERIEVLRGPAASLYGGSAAGGIISVITQNAASAPLFGEAYGIAGSNNFWKGLGQFGGTSNDVNYRISFSRTMGDGYRDHTHFRGNNVYGKATYTPSNQVQLSPIFSYTDVFHENPEGINLAQYQQDPKQPNPDAIPFNEFLETERVAGGLLGTINTPNGHEIQFNGYVKRSTFTEANNRTFNHRTLTTPGTSLQYTINHGRAEDFTRNRIGVGTDLQWQTIDEHRTDNLHAIEGDTVRSKEQMEQRGMGLFIVDKLDVGTHWSFMASLRYDKIRSELNDLLATPHDLSGSAEFSKTTGRLGATFSPIEEVNVYANWGQGFMAPATEELAQNPDHFGGFNVHLVPATSDNYELGVRGMLKEKNLYYDVTGFYLRTDNDFDRYRITDPLRIQETFYRNAGSSRRFGLELFTKYSPMRTVDIQAAYTYSHFKYNNATPLRIMMDDPTIVKYIVDGNWLPNSPMHQLALDVEYALSPGWFVGLSTETLSKTYIDGANVGSEAAEGYTLVNGRAGHNWHMEGAAIQMSINFRNIGDAKYVAFTEPDPGGNSYQPGSGREVFGALRVQF